MTDAIEPSQIRAYLGEEAASNLHNYFHGSGTKLFTGSSFERFAGGGDRPEVANHFTAEDIVAVSMLSVDIPGRASLEILDFRAGELNELLAGIPTGLDLWDDEAEKAIAEGSSSRVLWDELMEIEQVGWVTAGKLLARKRPRLIPVYDTVLKQAFTLPRGTSWWTALRDVLRTDPSLVSDAIALRSAAGLDDTISVLRIIDVVVWMKNR
ncbi:MAG: DUF6308 family protein [Microthrixaceae bacterium]